MKYIAISLLSLVILVCFTFQTQPVKYKKGIYKSGDISRGLYSIHVYEIVGSDGKVRIALISDAKQHNISISE